MFVFHFLFSILYSTEKYIVKDFQKRYPNVIKDAKVGFMSPHKDAMENPSYRQVCSGTTGHVEVLNVELTDEACQTPEVYTELIKFFFMFHDPTTLNRQGNDVGTQYSSIVFTTSQEQYDIANSIKEELQSFINTKVVTSYSEKTVHTGIVDYTKFYPAHEEHQEYLMKNPNGYCNHRYRFKTWPETKKSEL